MYFKEESNVSLAEYSNIGPGLKLLRLSYLNIRLACLSLSYLTSYLTQLKVILLKYG